MLKPEDNHRLDGSALEALKRRCVRSAGRQTGEHCPQAGRIDAPRNPGLADADALRRVQAEL